MQFTCHDHSYSAFGSKSGHFGPSDGLFRGFRGHFGTIGGPKRVCFAHKMAVWGPQKGSNGP